MIGGTGSARRAYKTVAVVGAAGGYGIALDSKPLRSPAKRELVLPVRALAEAIAAEWEAQAERVDPRSMPLMQLASTAIDQVIPHRGDLLNELRRYAGSDLLCYRADRPTALVERQARAWQPLLDWADERYGARLHPVEGVMPVAQPAQAIERLAAAAAALDDWRLTALAVATSTAGSLVVALALVAGRLDAEAAFDAAELDETYQIEQWGADEQAEARRAVRLADLRSVERLVKLLDDGSRQRLAGDAT